MAGSHALTEWLGWLKPCPVAFEQLPAEGAVSRPSYSLVTEDDQRARRPGHRTCVCFPTMLSCDVVPTSGRHLLAATVLLRPQRTRVATVRSFRA